MISLKRIPNGYITVISNVQLYLPQHYATLKGLAL